MKRILFLFVAFWVNVSFAQLTNITGIIASSGGNSTLCPSSVTVGSNSTVLVGNTLSLTCNTIPSATYAWSGPNSFTSSSQNPTISSVTTAAGGNYTVVVTPPSCSSVTGITGVVVNDYDADAKAYFAAVTTPLSSGRKTIISNLVVTLKTDGNWTKLDRLGILASEAEDQALVDIKALTTSVKHGSPTFTANQGYKGNGTNGYVDILYTPSTDGVNYTLNSCSYGFYVRVLAEENRCDMGCLQGSNYAFAYSDETGGLITEAGINDAGYTSGNISGTDKYGLFSYVRTASNATAIYEKGSSIGTGSVTSTALPGRSFYLLARNDAGTADAFNNKQLSAYFAGSGTIDQANLNTAIQTAIVAIGASPY